MVSYFVPRGRFLIKAGNLRRVAHQKQHLQQQPGGKWPVLRNFCQSFTNKSSVAPDAKSQNEVKVDTSVNTKLISKDYSRHRNIKEEQTKNFWSKWTGFLLRWTPVGLCLFGAIEWQLHRKKCERDQLPRTASEFQSKMYCSMPLRIISRCWGWLAACYVPVPFRPYLYGLYSNVFKVNMEEALYSDYKHYNSLSEFFTRPLCEGARIIDNVAPLVSPADGKVLHFGSATNSLIEQVKGVNYSVETFLGPPTWVRKSPDVAKDYSEMIQERHDGSTTLYQCVIYLAPGDYHRFHSPTSWHPTIRRHFAGELLSVSPKIATWLPGLFCLNERAVYLGKWNFGFFSYTAVGATNVGSVQIYMDDNLKTNRWVGFNVGTHKRGHEYEEMILSNDAKLDRGEVVGQFNMGSTIVLLFEAPKNFKFNIEAGQKIRVGEPLGHFEGQ